MELDEIFSEWSTDAQIDNHELDTEAMKQSVLHAKYLKFLAMEGLLYKRLDTEHAVLYSDKTKYYRGEMDDDDLAEYGWEPYYKKINKTEVKVYVDADKEIVKSTLKLHYQKEKVNVLENILRSINNRGFQIKNSIDWIRFQSGG